MTHRGDDGESVGVEAPGKEFATGGYHGGVEGRDGEAIEAPRTK